MIAHTIMIAVSPTPMPTAVSLLFDDSVALGFAEAEGKGKAVVETVVEPAVVVLLVLGSGEDVTSIAGASACRPDHVFDPLNGRLGSKRNSTTSCPGMTSQGLANRSIVKLQLDTVVNP
jgi:hypothetical protein